MHSRTIFITSILISALFGLGQISFAGDSSIPLAYDVDVLVVGGSSAGVAAAVAAAESGASVFLAAEEMYLGDDVAGTLRLSLTPEEDPTTQKLAAKLWGSDSSQGSLPFSYTASKPSIGLHKDSVPPEMLADGVYERADSQSVEYTGPVQLTVDLGSSCRLEEITLMVFRREGVFDLGSASVQGSQSGDQWEALGELKSDAPYQEDHAHPYTLNTRSSFRYLRFDLAPAPSLKRLLLGEIIINGKSVRTPRPLHVKHVLDQALLEAGVEFLFGCYPSQVLVDDQGHAAGAVIVNREGQQAIRARTVIDATSRGILARRLGAEFTPYPSGKQRFSFVTVGQEINDHPDIADVKTLPAPYWNPDVEKMTYPDGSDYPAGAPAGYEQMFHEYQLEIPMNGGTFSAFANAEQLARTATWNTSQIKSADLLFQIPPDQMKGAATVTEWEGSAHFNLDALRTPASKHFFLLGGCASADRTVAEKLLRPVAFMQVGERVGRAAAAESAAIPAPAAIQVKSGTAPDLPILGKFDVIVVGGGTAGGPAAIAAAREGARTLVIERFHGLGGVSTLGGIGVYCDGLRGGFTRELDEGLKHLGSNAINRTTINWPAWNNQWKQEWVRSEILAAGGTIWFGTCGTGAATEGNQVKGVRVATPFGQGIVLADTVVDATGNADIASAAGAKTVFVDEFNNALQGTGLSVRNPYMVSKHKHPDYSNTDYTFLDENNMVDTWRLHVGGRDRFKKDFDVSPLANTRERRRIIGEFIIMPTDILAGRTYPDTIAQAYSAFDTHGFTLHPVWDIKPPSSNHVKDHADIPYRALLPEALDGILVCGIGISGHRDAMPVLRMQPDVQNTGYAAGLAAAMAARAGLSPRDINVHELQARLVEKGCIQASVLNNQDLFPLSPETLQEALKDPLKDHRNIARILNEWPRALPELQQRYAALSDEATKTDYALMFGIMGDATGADQLLAEVGKRPWDAGWNFTGGGQFGGSMSELDRLIVALGRTGDPEAVSPLLEKMEALTAQSEFSHFRAVAMASDSLKDPRLAAGLHRLLSLNGVRGWDISSSSILKTDSPAFFSDRSNTLRELFLARALYRCGDVNHAAKETLERYAEDVRGYYSLQAKSILKN